MDIKELSHEDVDRIQRAQGYSPVVGSADYGNGPSNFIKPGNILTRVTRQVLYLG
jgi:hypothetical protein